MPKFSAGWPRALRMLILSLPLVAPAMLSALFAVTSMGPLQLAFVPRASLVWHGLAVAVISGALGLAFLYRDRSRWTTRARLAVLLLAFFGAPLWAFGVLPTVNNLHHGEPQTAVMQLKGVAVSVAPEGQAPRYWAYLMPKPASALPPGAYAIDKAQYDAWDKAHPATVSVQWVRGLLGCRLVESLRAER